MATNVEHRQVSSCVVKVDGQVAAQTAAGPHGQASTGVLESARVAYGRTRLTEDNLP